MKARRYWFTEYDIQVGIDKHDDRIDYVLVEDAEEVAMDAVPLTMEQVVAALNLAGVPIHYVHDVLHECFSPAEET